MASILIVAEDRIARRIAWVLEDAGHTTRVANDGASGVRDAERFRPDVVVVNGVVEGGELQFASDLARAAPSARLLDVSQKLGEPGQPVVADAALVQPFHADELLEEVARLLS
jgi:DNA-binding response OmpR family regulator